MADKYRSFKELSTSENEGVDFRVCVNPRASTVAIVAPHGGKIEHGTSEITLAIGGDELSTYCFEGTKRARNSDLHITSSRFDEWRCRSLIEDAEVIVGIHGRKDKDDATTVWVGGRNTAMRDTIVAALIDAGFDAAVDNKSALSGTDPQNICNLGKSGKGVQLEIPASLRKQLTNNNGRLTTFAAAIRSGIKSNPG